MTNTNITPTPSACFSLEYTPLDYSKVNSDNKKGSCKIRAIEVYDTFNPKRLLEVRFVSCSDEEGRYHAGFD